MDSETSEQSIENHGKLFSLQVKCLNAIGFNRKRSKQFPIIFQFLHAINVSFVVFAVLTEFTFVCINFNDVLVSAEAFGPLSTEIITIAKLLTFMIYEKDFYKLMDKIQTLSRDTKTIHIANKLDQTVTLTYLCSGIFTGVVLCFARLTVDLIGAWFYELELKREMPVKSVLPFDVTSSPAYEITYLLYCCATYVTVIQSVRYFLQTLN